ncbi:MAG: hypothetical protein VYE40_07585 [Myxococcota bacterium]|nr:hypothetical protein [Myxococcota bacterium]
MQPSDQSFGELRAILHAEPDERTWSQLCEFFDPFPSDKQETTQVEVMGWQEKLLDYAIGITRHWPISLCQPSRAWLEELYRGASHPKFKLLRSLRFRNNAASDEGLINLGKEPYLDHISSLYILGMNLNEDHIQALTSGNLFGKLTHLELWSNGLDRHLLLSLLERAPALLESLETLELPKNRIGDEGALLIARRRWERLRVLNLWHTGISNVGARALETTKNLTALEQLNLGSNTGIGRDMLHLLEQGANFAPGFELRS